MTALDMPTSPGFTDCRFFLETNTQRFESPITKTVQRVVLSGSRWNATYSLPAMTRAQAAVWQAFFLLLEGSSGTFNAFNPDKKSPRGAGGGTPLVEGYGYTASTMGTDGWPNNTVVLKAGDMFSVNGELKMVTADVLTNGSGQGTILFKPALRAIPPDNAPITVIRPTCTMILADDNQAAWDCNHNGIYQPKTFTAFEVFS